MDTAIWPRIASIWPSGQHFEAEVDRLHEEDDVVEVEVADARALHEPATLDREGFALLPSPVRAESFDDPSYLEETAELVKQATGAKLVVPFHFVQMNTSRDSFGKRGGAVERVHGDYTKESGPLMLDELRLRGVVPAETAQMPGAILNVWRNAAAEEVQSKPLAVCDARSVDPDDFGKYHLVEGGEVARRRVGLNLSLPYSPRHRWYYYPRMRRDAALMFFPYDGRLPEHPRFTMHAAFDPSGTPDDAPPRTCVIVRLAAFF